MISLTQLIRGYDPELDAVRSPSRKSKLERSTRPSVILGDTESVIKSANHHKGLIEEGENRFSWDSAKRNKTPVDGRVSHLTEYDYAELAAAKDKKFEEKAMLIKIYWAAKIPLRETVKEINRAGYRKSTVASYCGCFTRAHESWSKSVQMDQSQL